VLLKVDFMYARPVGTDFFSRLLDFALFLGGTLSSLFTH